MDQQLVNLAISFPDVGVAMLTVLGIGLVIFVHEAGHFMCARACGVDVEVFSLGFGPRLFGVVRGGTDYRISLVPIGGYVKMLGDQPGEGEGDPRALTSKSVGQRFLVYSGGVIMNVVFALVAFPILFTIGVPLARPAVGAVTPGGAAWEAGLQEHDEILEINGRRILGFSDITLEIALTDPNNTTIRIERDGVEQVTKATPRYSEGQGTLALGIGQPIRYDLQVEPDGPAAKSGLRDGDVLVEIDGYPANMRSMRRLEVPRSDVIPVVVQRDGVLVPVGLTPTFRDASDAKLLGIRTLENVVVGIRGRLAAEGTFLHRGDAVMTLAGRPVYDVLDIEDIARDLLRDDPEPSGEVPLEIVRNGQREEIALPVAHLVDLASDVAYQARDAEELTSEIPVVVTLGSAAASAGLTSGMRLLRVGGQDIERWSDVRTAVENADGAELQVVALTEDGRRESFAVTPATMRTAETGILFAADVVERSYDVGEAFTVGMYSSWNLARQAYLTLRKMVSRQVDAKNLGGPIAITAVSYHFAKSGLAKLFYFLALLSINLAVVNILPIPILDGGHLFFLLIEKVKGSPVDDRVMGYSQVFGLMVILSLLIFVTYNDIMRLFE